MDQEANRIIDAIGGTGDTARLCEVSAAAVSQWRDDGIPKARMMFLRLARPDLFTPAVPPADEPVGLAVGG